MSVTTSSVAAPGRVRRPVRVISRLPEAPVAPVAEARPATAPATDLSWRRRLLGDLWLFLAVLAVGLIVAVVAALV